jgi:hypothetical protein
MRILLLGIIWGGLGAAAGRATVPSTPVGTPGSTVAFTAAPAIIEIPPEPERSRWKAALGQSLRFLAIEHGFRLFQRKTRRELSGPFLKDYQASVKNLGGWGDGDSKFTNYVAHPMQGAAAGYIQIQNDPKGREAEFGRSKQYWQSRFKAFAWSAGYSTQFELGPISEASVGNVGMKKGTMGFVDLVVTPVGGLGMMVAEDVLERFLLRPIESRTTSPRKRAFFRVLLNPSRSFAGVLGDRLPWHRRGGEWSDAQRKSPGHSPYEFLAPADETELKKDSLWPGVWRAACPAPHELGEPAPHNSSCWLGSPHVPAPEPTPFSMLIPTGPAAAPPFVATPLAFPVPQG